MMTEDIETEIESLRKLKKPYRDLSYDQICEMVNFEISKLGEDFTAGDLGEIDKKLGFPRGTSFEAGGYSDYFAFEETDED